MPRRVSRPELFPGLGRCGVPEKYRDLNKSRRNWLHRKENDRHGRASLRMCFISNVDAADGRIDFRDSNQGPPTWAVHVEYYSRSSQNIPFMFDTGSDLVIERLLPFEWDVSYLSDPGIRYWNCVSAREYHCSHLNRGIEGSLWVTVFCRQDMSESPLMPSPLQLMVKENCIAAAAWEGNSNRWSTPTHTFSRLPGTTGPTPVGAEWPWTDGREIEAQDSAAAENRNAGNEDSPASQGVTGLEATQNAPAEHQTAPQSDDEPAPTPMQRRLRKVVSWLHSLQADSREGLEESQTEQEGMEEPETQVAPARQRRTLSEWLRDKMDWYPRRYDAGSNGFNRRRAIVPPPDP